MSGFLLVVLSVMATIATDKLTLIPYAMERSKNNSATIACLIPNVGPEMSEQYLQLKYNSKIKW